MILINLLPHREEARKKLREGFYANIGVAFIIGLVIVAGAWFVLDMMKNAQNTRNEFLTQRNSELDRQIVQIKALNEDITALQARQTAVENLQSDRNLAVHWMEELARQTPDGIFLTKAQQRELSLTIEGVTLSNDRVSEFLAKTAAGRSNWMTNSQWIGSIEAKNMQLAPNEPARRVFTFSMQFDLVRENATNAGM